jgi:hypothetical protein
MAIQITRVGTPLPGAGFPSPEVKFTATVRIGKGQCNWCSDPGTFMITDHTGWEDVACRTHTDEWFPGTLPAYGSEGVETLDQRDAAFDAEWAVDQSSLPAYLRD